jgi:hypothetical protein
MPLIKTLRHCLSWGYLKDHRIWSGVISSLIAAGVLAVVAWMGRRFDWWLVFLATSPIPHWLLALLVLLILTLTALLFRARNQRGELNDKDGVPEATETGRDSAYREQKALTMLRELAKLDRGGRAVLEHLVTVGEELEQSSIHVTGVGKRYAIDDALRHCQDVGFLRERSVKLRTGTFPLPTFQIVSYWKVFDVWTPVLKKIFSAPTEQQK